MKPAPLTAAEETEVSRLIAIGRNPVWARQRVTEDRFRRRGVAPAIKAVGGGRANALVPKTDQRSESNTLHAVQPIGRKHEGVPEVRTELP